MKITSLISNTCAASIVALSFVACSDYDNGFTDKEIAFQEAFKQRFGVIDPEQDWNLATRGTLKVNFKEETNVKIYSKNPLAPGAVLMANYNVSAPSVLGFDMPEGTKDVFVQATSNRGMIVNGYVDMIANEGEVVPMDDVENEVPETTIIDVDEPTELFVYQKQVPKQDDEYNKEPQVNTYKLYSLDKVKTTTPNAWKVGDFRKILSTYEVTTADGTVVTRQGVFKEGKNNWFQWMVNGVDGKTLNDNAFITTAEKTPISVTLNYRNTSNTSNKFAYFYYEGDLPSYENIKLYNLIDKPTDTQDEYGKDYVTWNAWDSNKMTPFNGGLSEEYVTDNMKVQGTTFHLVYFGKAGSSSTEGQLTSLTPIEISYEFPEDVNIGFAIIQPQESIKEEGDAEGANRTDYVWFSIADLNPTATDWNTSGFNGENYSAAATFFYNGTTFLGFEDCPINVEEADDSERKGEYTSDYNDLLFWITGSIDDVGDVDEDPEIPLQGWIISAEDLGTTDDIDYNDVVIEVQHASGVDGQYVYVTPLAAGGTLASYLYFKDRLVGASSGLSGEIHALLDDNYKQELTSGDYEPLNVKAKTITKKGKPIPVNVGVNFSLSPSEVGAENPDANMGGFNIRVVPQGKKKSELEKEGVALQKLQRIQNSGTTGEAPFVICTPNSWSRTENRDGEDWIISGHYRWPWEQCNITKAYSENEHSFEKWVANKSDAIDWYAYPEPSLTCAPGVISERFDDGTVEPEPGPGTGNTFPSDAGDDIEVINEDDNWGYIAYSDIEDYEECTITLHISGFSNSWCNVAYTKNGNDCTNLLRNSQGESLTAEKLKNSSEGIFTMTLSRDEIKKFYNPNNSINGIWFNGLTIEQAAIKGTIIVDERQEMPVGEEVTYTSHVTLDKTEYGNTYHYKILFNEYKLPKNFAGSAKIVITTGANVGSINLYYGDVRDYNKTAGTAGPDNSNNQTMTVNDITKLKYLFEEQCGVLVYSYYGSSDGDPSITSVTITLSEE